jgi:phage repressor protein C with HTH and peptisase S24 domain
MHGYVNKKVAKRKYIFADRIKRVRHLALLSQEDLAGKIGINRNTYVSYESGNRRLPLEVAESVCRILKVRPEFLLAGKDPVFEEHPATGQFIYLRRCEARAREVQDGVSEDEMVAFRRELFEALGLRENAAGVIVIKGDSMEPVLKDRDWVLLDMAVSRVIRAGIYCFQVADDLICRTCAKDQDGIVHAMSHNKIYEGLEPFNFKFAETDPRAPRVVGRAVWFSRNL